MKLSKTINAVAITILVASEVALTIDVPVVCMSAPVVSLYPGLPVTASLDSQGTRCEATLTFSNPDFFPVRFDFEDVSNCLGYQEAQFIVPEEVPNGDAFIQWRCTDQASPTCTKALISGGADDADSINFSQSGTISCVLPIATQTTLSTVVAPSTTFTETATSTVFSTSVLPTTTSSTSTDSMSAEVETLLTTFTSGLFVTLSTILSTVAPTAATDIQPMNTASPVSGETQTVTSTYDEGSTTAFSTFTSTIPPATGMSGVAQTSILTSLLTLTVTAPCTSL